MASANESTVRRHFMVRRWFGAEDCVMTKFVLALVVAGAVLLQLPGAVAQAAGPPMEGCGTFSILSTTVVEIRAAGGNTIVTDVVTGNLTGLFSGPLVAERRIVLHPDGTISGQARETFTGNFAGQTGGLVFRLVFTGDATAGVFSGSFIIVSGTGGLANLHGEGTFTGSLVTGAGSYCAQVVAAP
jgi:hypothetical protein